MQYFFPTAIPFLVLALLGHSARALLNFTVFEPWRYGGKTMLSDLIKRLRVIPSHQLNVLNEHYPPARAGGRYALLRRSPEPGKAWADILRGLEVERLVLVERHKPQSNLLFQRIDNLNESLTLPFLQLFRVDVIFHLRLQVEVSTFRNRLLIREKKEWLGKNSKH